MSESFQYARRRTVLVGHGNPFKHTYILDNGLYVPSDTLYIGKRVRVIGVKKDMPVHAFSVGEIVFCSELIPDQPVDRFRGPDDQDTLYPEEYEDVLI